MRQFDKIFFPKIKDKLKDVGIEVIELDSNNLEAKFGEERNFRSVFFDSINEIENQMILGSKIEKFKFILEYDAIWSNELDIIESGIEYSGNLLGSGAVFKRLKTILGIEKDNKEIIIKIPDTNIMLNISYASLEYRILRGLRDEQYNFILNEDEVLTLKILGVKPATHDIARSALLKLSNSIFFQIELKNNLPINPIVDSNISRNVTWRKRTIRKIELKLPLYEYNVKVMSLYWFAISLQNMPLFQFLAFYQIIEFYFPKYVFKEAKDNLKNMLIDPRINFEDDVSITKIIHSVTNSLGKSGNYIEERSQLKSLIRQVVTNNDLKEYIVSVDERKTFFDSSTKNIGLAAQQLNINSKDNDLRDELAFRIYELRCKIVHTKEAVMNEIIIPFSKEVQKLKFDLEIMEFLVRRIIISEGKRLTI